MRHDGTSMPHVGSSNISTFFHVDASQLMQPFSEFLRDIGRVHGQWQLSDVNPFTKKCCFELCQHKDEQIGFGCMIPTLFWTKQQMQRQSYVMDGEHYTK